jgi:serine/threonine-protein kinase
MPRESTTTTSTTTTDCPPEALFVELIEGRLAKADLAGLRRHAEKCEACHVLVDELTLAETTPSRRSEITVRAARMLIEGTAAERPPPRPGETIGRHYRLVRRIGAGGMGSVYEAEHTGTGATFAVKLIHGATLARGGRAPARFRREARAAGALASPHIVRVVDSGVDDVTGDLYLVMEYLRGEDLQQLIDRAGPLCPDVALRIVAQALVGLVEAHAAGIVHRDIKPANIFLARSGDGGVTVKLLDFGIAKMGPDPLTLPHTTGITHTGGLLGSPLYMSPEQVQNGKDVDHRTDLWSMGTTLYAALAGQAPHRDATTVGKLILAICSSPAPPLADCAPWVQPEVAAAVHRALAIEREGRYPSAAAMLEALRGLVPGGTALREEMLAGITPEERATLAPRPEKATPRAFARGSRLRRVLLVAAAAALVVGMAAGGYGVQRRRARAAVAAPPPEPAVAASPFASSEAHEVPRRVLLVVFPEDAAVEVDGARAEVQGGAVEIEGLLGSFHQVRVRKGEVEAAVRVTVTERGASPPKVELPPRRAPTASGRLPVATVEAPHPPVETAPASSAPPRRTGPSVEEIMRQPE